MNLVVVSTGFRAPTRQRCLDSVSMQKGVPFRHFYVEASDQDPPRDVITNQKDVIDGNGIMPDDVIVILDGDDRLAHDRVLERVHEMHSAGAWVTYGSFAFEDGRAGFASQYGPDENVRTSDWRATHLKTVRAGLVHRLRPEDVTWPAGAPVPWDMLVMFAAIEQAGWDRSIFCPEVLAFYNFASSHEARTGAEGRAAEQSYEAVLRARAPYARIDAL